MTVDRQPPKGLRTMSVERCPGGARHWFAYRGWVGSSSPICVRYGCSQPNPRYDSDRDPHACTCDWCNMTDTPCLRERQRRGETP